MRQREEALPSHHRTTNRILTTWETQSACRFRHRRISCLQTRGDAEVERFATTPEGAELVQEWGDDADARLSMIQTRLLRLEDAGDIEAAWAWFDALPSPQAKAVLKVLAQ